MWNKVKRINTEFLGINNRNVGFVFPNNPRKHYPLADDKVKAKLLMEKNGVNCATTYAIIEKIGEIPEKWKAMEPYEKLAIKPANGSGGDGILILSKGRNGEWLSKGKVIPEDQIYLYLANIIMGVHSFGSSDKVLIEECIESHSFFYSLFPEGVADFRIIVYKGCPALGMLRVPTQKSNGKANLHQGGLGIGVDLETGKLLKGYDGKEYHDQHPDTQAQISGVQLPYWSEILDLSLNTARHFPLQYLGVDIVIDQNKGPLVMEVNVRPGLGIQMVNQKGLKPILEQIDNQNNIL